jgi:PBSX family phage terminase large subunit
VTDERSVDIGLFPKQLRFVRDTRRFPAYIGGIGSGKSYAFAAKVLWRCIEYPGNVGMIGAPTFGMLRDATMRTMYEMLDASKVPYRVFRGDKIIELPSLGSEIMYRSLHNPENARGPNLNWVGVDEGSLISKMAWDIVKGRARTGADPQAWGAMTPKGRNYAWEEWERDATGDESDRLRPLYRARTSENPTLPDDFAESLGYTGKFALQELEGLFVAFEGMVYEHFTRQAHVKIVADEQLSEWLDAVSKMRAILGVDVGTRNPTAIVTVRGEPEHYHIEREHYRAGMNSEEIIEAIIDEYKRSRADVVYLDPSALAYIETLKAKGIPAEKAVNDVTFGIGEVAKELASGMTIDSECVNTISEFETYHYPEGARANTDKPAKEGDHAMDAVRYAIASEAMIPKPRIWVA